MEKHPWKILLVDDDEEDYLITRGMLSDSPQKKIKLDWAPDLNSGRKALHSNHYDAVLVDYDLGGDTGLTLVKEMAHRDYRAPFILYTGRDSYEIDVEAMQAGVTLYLTKNEANSLLLERSIRYAIERKQAEQALEEANQLLQKQKDELEVKNRQLKDAVRAVAESSERFRSLFNSMTEGFALHEMILDDQGSPMDYRFLEINPAFESLTGLRRADVINRLKSEVLPDDDRSWIDIYGKVALTGEAVRFEQRSTALQQFYEIFAYSPKPGQFAVIFKNITPHKQMEMINHANLVKYHTLFEAFPYGISLADDAGQIVEINAEAERLLGVPSQEHMERMIDGPEWRIIRPDGTTMPAEEYASTRAMKEQRRVDGVKMGIVQPDGGVRWIEVSAVPLPLPGYGPLISYKEISLEKSDQGRDPKARTEDQPGI